MIYLTVLVVLLVIVGLNTVVVVPMREACVVERLGKFRKVLSPGLHLLIPFFDRIAYRHEMREEPLDVPPQSCITRDNMQVTVDGLIYLKVMNPKRASYGIENYRRASVNLAQTTMRSEIGKLALHEAFAERDKLNDAIVREIDKASDPWGIKVLRYEVKNITPSSTVIHTLERQMEAERARRAEVTLATAEKEAMINRSEGQRQEAINLSNGEKQRRINEAKGRAREIQILAESTSKGISLVASALARPGGQRAARMRIVEQFIGELGRIVRSSNVSVVPAELAKIESTFRGIGSVSQTIAAGSGNGSGNGTQRREP